MNEFAQARQELEQQGRVRWNGEVRNGLPVYIATGMTWFECPFCHQQWLAPEGVAELDADRARYVQWSAPENVEGKVGPAWQERHAEGCPYRREGDYIVDPGGQSVAAWRAPDLDPERLRQFILDLVLSGHVVETGRYRNGKRVYARTEKELPGEWNAGWIESEIEGPALGEIVVWSLTLQDFDDELAERGVSADGLSTDELLELSAYAGSPRVLGLFLEATDWAAEQLVARRKRE